LGGGVAIDARFKEAGTEKLADLEVPRQCPLVLLVEVF
jgi:hypothetical protein